MTVNEKLEELCNSLKADGFDEVVCNRLLDSYKAKYMTMEDIPTREQAIADFKRMTDLLMEEYAAKEKAAKVRREIEETERHDMAISTDWEAKLSTYVGNDIISTLDVIEELYPMLSKEQQEHYYNIPAYAAFDLKDSDIFMRAYNSCIEKYRRSQGVKAKVNQYLSTLTDDVSMYPYHIDRLIATLPSSYDRKEDSYVLAYKAICILEDSNSKEEHIDLSAHKDEMKKQYIKQIKDGDPAYVASRGGLEVGLTALGKSIGKTMSYPKYTVQTFKNAVGVGQNELLGNVVPQQAPSPQYQQPQQKQNKKFSIGKFILILLALLIGWQLFKALPIIKMIGIVILIALAGLAYKIVSR